MILVTVKLTLHMQAEQNMEVCHFFPQADRCSVSSWKTWSQHR